MQILIDIPEWIYTQIQDIGLNNYSLIKYTANAIRQGIVLPEKHGRLIDADRLERNISHFQSILYHTPSIIEAESEVDE